MSHTGNGVIYEVNLEVEAAIAEAFAAWLPGHVERMCALPGFVDAAIERVERNAEENSAWCVRYRLADRAALEAYFRDHAEAMRAEGLERFGKRFTATRRILRSIADRDYISHTLQVRN